MTVVKTTAPSPASALGPTLSELPQPADEANADAVAANEAKRAREARDARERKEEANTIEAVR